MQRFLLISLLFSAILPTQQAPTPKTMTRMEVILQSPDAPTGSFAAKPKVFYRAGTQYCRIEEALDTERGIHHLLIVNEPEFWMVNLVDNTAQHGVDPGPTFNCHLPIFPSQASKLSPEQRSDVMALEFGNELEYFKKKGATAQKGPVLQTKQTVMYQATIGDVTLALFTYGSDIPLGVAWVRADEHDIFWYSGYGEVNFDAKLFALPEHVKIVTPKP